MSKKYKGSLRLDWINKDLSLYYEIDEKEGRGVSPVWVPRNDIRVSEPRILRFIESVGDTKNDNMLIKGDNLLVLRSLVEMFKGRSDKEKVKCIYIDPPYNTGNAFQHYDDNLRHSEWLAMMRDRLVLLRKLLRKDGVIVVQVGFDEMAYLKVLMDEIFKRDNCIGQVAVRMSHSAGMKRQAADKRLIKNTEYLLFYFNSVQPILKPIYEPTTEYPVNYYQWILDYPTRTKRGKYAPLKEIVGETFSEAFSSNNLPKTNNGIRELFKRDENFRNFIFSNKDRVCRLHGEVPDIEISKKIADDQFLEITKGDRSYFMGKGKQGNVYQLIPLTEKVREIAVEDDEGNTTFKNSITNLLGDWWDGYWRDMSRVDVEGGVLMKESKKPERIIYSIFKLITEPDDLVLDSFLGSGTTVAVAQKMGLRWIGVELGNHAEDIAKTRLTNVVNGSDSSGISNIVNWKGGGGFKYYKLGESLLREQDMNWGLKTSEMAEAVFLHFQYKLWQVPEFETMGLHLGKHKSSSYHYAVFFAARDLKTLTEELYDEITLFLEKEKFRHLTIFTNAPLSVARESIDERVMIKKIPAAILREYDLI